MGGLSHSDCRAAGSSPLRALPGSLWHRERSQACPWPPWGPETVLPEGASRRGCWGPGLCRWGFPLPAWALAKTLGVSDSWFSSLYREFSRTELASLSSEFQAHPSRTSRRSSNRPWRRWPGRPRRWTCVPETGEEARSFTKVYRPLLAPSSLARK